MAKPSFYGVTHVDVPTRDLGRARAFYSDALGFPVTRHGDGFVDVDTGSVVLRLVEVTQPDRRAAVRVGVREVEAAYRFLLEHGARSLAEPMRTPALELLASVADPDGNTVTLQRDLSEDEYGFVPELPVEMGWQPDAEALLKSMLQSVPALFRALARRKVVRNAEHVSRSRGGHRVERDHVVRAFILSNARITRHRVVEPLRKHGFDPAAYPEEFDA